MSFLQGPHRNVVIAAIRLERRRDAVTGDA
jgi:hypothetical protein